MEQDCCLLVATEEKGGVFSGWSWDSGELHCAPNSREKWTAACPQPQLAPDQLQQSRLSSERCRRQHKAEGQKLEAQGHSSQLPPYRTHSNIRASAQASRQDDDAQAQRHLQGVRRGQLLQTEHSRGGKLHSQKHKEHHMVQCSSVCEFRSTD